MAGALQQLLSGLVGIGDAYVRQGVRVSVKTNYGPELPLFSGAIARTSSGGEAGGGLSLGGLVGLKAAIIVRDARGNTLATYGNPPPTDKVRVAVALTLAGALVYLVLRGLLK